MLLNNKNKANMSKENAKETSDTTFATMNGKSITNGKPVVNGRNTPHTDANTMPPQKSVIIAYIMWLFGGIFGLHHLYLHRDRHAFIWWCTLGGYFGVGWLAEIALIPEYVRDANEDPAFIKSFVARLQANRRPPYSAKRFVGEVMIGYLFGQVVLMAIPETIFAGIDWGFLHWLIPVFISIGVWTVGNIGRERGVWWHCLIAAILIYPTRYLIYDETYSLLLTALVSALVFDSYSKQWLRTPPKRHTLVKRSFKFTAALLIYFSFWGCFLYFNGTISDEEGGEVPIHEALRNFLTSTWWTDFTQALKDTYQYAQHHGWYETWKEIFESMDVDGERNSYKVLGVSATASQAEITSAYRRLSKEFHPDKVKDEKLKAAANQRFIEIQQAYNVLSKIKSSRRRKNKKSVEDEPIVL
ncbi:dnaJ homolog subfamily C member 22 isoform X2 [Ceratitis capitata]|uniref:dnaJ homolog subfamily C member 22 isoform X2 n=1 Tax=Ceratitis capitata TaxID=7213 RepID=UPI0003297C69|nr:dnaJ homolog subfamily C member 22 isoform X2 [Ceratitis capitata]